MGPVTEQSPMSYSYNSPLSYQSSNLEKKLGHTNKNETTGEQKIIEGIKYLCANKPALVKDLL